MLKTTFYKKYRISGIRCALLFSCCIQAAFSDVTTPSRPSLKTPDKPLYSKTLSELSTGEVVTLTKEGCSQKLKEYLLKNLQSVFDHTSLTGINADLAAKRGELIRKCPEGGKDFSNYVTHLYPGDKKLLDNYTSLIKSIEILKETIDSNVHNSEQLFPPKKTGARYSDPQNYEGSLKKFKAELDIHLKSITNASSQVINRISDYENEGINKRIAEAIKVYNDTNPQKKMDIINLSKEQILNLTRDPSEQAKSDHIPVMPIRKHADRRKAISIPKGDLHHSQK
jgi:hypothetical protein